MSDPNKIREAVAEVLRSLTPYYSAWELDHGVDGEDLYRRLEGAYADSLEDPIWWCFEHNQRAHDGYLVCSAARIIGGACDIAKATRPRRIE